MDTVYYIYALLDFDNNPFYVGKTNCIARRKHGHLGMAKKGYVSPVYAKIRKLQRNGWLFNFEILETCDENTVDNQERFHIQRLKDEGFKLTNLAEGGEGGCSSESAKKGAETRRNNGYLHHTEETKQKISQAHSGVAKSESHKESLKKAWKRTPEQLKSTGKKISTTNKGKINIKPYLCIDPSGVEYTITEGLTKFCEERGLTTTNMVKVANGERPMHKGWKCQRISSNQD